MNELLRPELKENTSKMIESQYDREIWNVSTSSFSKLSVSSWNPMGEEHHSALL